MEQNLDPFRAIGAARAILVVSLVTAGPLRQTHRHGRPTPEAAALAEHADLARERAAVDPELGACDVRGLVRGEEQRGVGDFLDSPGAT